MGTTTITWPKPPLGHGQPARYSDAELRYVRGFIRQYEAGEITVREMERQIGVCHALKVEFGVDISPGVEAEAMLAAPRPARKRSPSKRAPAQRRRRRA